MHALTITASLLASTLFSTVTAAPQGPPAGANGQLVTYYGQKGVDIDTLCADPNVDIVPLAFLTYFAKQTGGFPETNFANNCWKDEYYKDTKIFDKCHSFVNSIKTCQANGKKVLLSLGGDERTSDVSLSSPAQAAAVAKQLWSIFGPVSADYTGPRPFGDSVIDGFDFDVEGKQASANHGVLAQEFRKLFATDASKTYYLSAAPQCGFSDPLKTALATGAFDYVFAQFYNNECHARGFFNGGSFSNTWNQWSSWLQTTSPNTKLFLGLPGSPQGIESNGPWKNDFLQLDEVKTIVSSIGASSNFGGLMLWDYSLAAGYGNYQQGCKSAIGGPKPPKPTTSSTTTTSTTTTKYQPHPTTTTTTSEYTHPTTTSSEVPTWSTTSAEETTTTTTKPGNPHSTWSTTSAEETTTTTTKPGNPHSTWSTTSAEETTTTTTKPGNPHSTSSSTSVAETSTTTQPYWGDEDFSTSTTSSKDVSPTETPTWSDATWPTTSPVSPATTSTTSSAWSDYDVPSSTPVSPESTTTSVWSDYDVPSSTPASPESTTPGVWSDHSIPTLPTDVPAGPKTRYVTETVDVTLTECACTYEPTSTPVEAENTWSDYIVPAVPTVATTVAVVPVPTDTVKPSSPVSPISGEGPSSPITPFTGAAAEQQLTGTVFSVAVCVAVAVAGLFL